METMKVLPKKEMEAIIYDGSNIDDIREFCGNENVDADFIGKRLEVFSGSDGWAEVETDDVIMKDFDGISFKVINKETFDKYFKVSGNYNLIDTMNLWVRKLDMVEYDENIRIYVKDDIENCIKSIELDTNDFVHPEIPENKYGVHKTHCCVKHGCKYGNPNCPVVLGKIIQDYPCEDCDYENFDNTVFDLSGVQRKNNQVIIISNHDTKEYFVSSDHCEESPNGFVPTTHYLPSNCAPRESVPDGIIKNFQDVINVFYSDYKEIVNPCKGDK